MFHDANTYSSSQVAERLSIQPVTVRKYSQMLEEQGYSFKKDKNNWRVYSADDIEYLKYISNMKTSGKSLDESIRHIATLYRSKMSLSQHDTSLQDPQTLLIEFIKE